MKKITGFEFDEIYKNYFHFLYRQSKIKNEEIVLDFLINIAVGDGIYQDIGRFNVEFPSGKFSLFLKPRESGNFHNQTQSVDPHNFEIKSQLYSQINFVEHVYKDTLKYDVFWSIQRI